MKSADLARLSLSNDCLVYQGKEYPFATIAHIRFARMEVTTYVVPIKIGTDGSIGILLEFHSGEKLYFREMPGWFLTSNQQKINGILELYKHVSKATFDSRLQTYLSELQDRGYFSYSGYCFHAANRSIIQAGNNYTSDNTEFVKHYNYIELKPRDRGLLHNAKMQLWGGKLQTIDTLTDTDVFFSLLSHFYDMRWT